MILFAENDSRNFDIIEDRRINCSYISLIDTQMKGVFSEEHLFFFQTNSQESWKVERISEMPKWAKLEDQSTCVMNVFC